MDSIRLNWLDIAKGIGILLMVLGHSAIPILISNFIYAFHMPLFFIASGWLTNWQKKNFIVFVKRKFRTLLLPFVIYSFIILIIYIYQGWVDFENWIRNGWIAYALWFIPVLFIASLIAKLIFSIKNRYLVLICTFIFASISAVLSFYKILLPWNLSVVPYATFLVVVGTEMRRLISIVEYQKLWYILVLLSITIGISQFWRLDLCFNSILPFLPLTIGAIAGTLMIFMVSYSIDNHFKFLSTLLQKVGKETYLILGFSQIIIMLINEYFSLDPILKYSFLILCLLVIKYIKDYVNKLVKAKIL